MDATVAVGPGADASMSSAAFDELDPGEQEQVARRAFGELARSLSDVKAPDLLGEQPRVIDATPDR